MSKVDDKIYEIKKSLLYVKEVTDTFSTETLVEIFENIIECLENLESHEHDEYAYYDHYHDEYAYYDHEHDGYAEENHEH